MKVRRREAGQPAEHFRFTRSVVSNGRTSARRHGAVAVVAALTVAALATAGAQSAAAAGSGTIGGPAVNFHEPWTPPFKVLAQETPTECFVAIGEKHLPLKADGTCAKGVPTTTQTYMLGSTVSSDEKSLWWGTGTSVMCANLHSFDASLTKAGFGPVPAFRTKEAVCEFEQSYNAKTYGLGRAGDNQPPKIYQYVIATKKLIDRTPADPELTDIGAIGGYRAAGAFNGVVLMAGLEPGIGGGTGSAGYVHIAAFNEKTGEYLGQRQYKEYNNPKNFFDDGAALYLGVNLTTPHAGNGGQVLKWTGSLTDPFQFEVVGEFPGQPTYFARFENRLVASTWSNPTDNYAGLYVSPEVNYGKALTAADVTGWKKVFGMDQFFPDLLSARSMVGGGAVEYGGWLYWGAMNYPGTGTLAHMNVYPQLKPTSMEELYDLFLKSDPAAHVFRVKNLGKPNQQMQLLYGEKEYPTWDAKAGSDGTGAWVTKANRLNLKPMYGHQGFGNVWQRYSSWGITKYHGKVIMGGFDISKIYRDVLFNPDSGIWESFTKKPVSAAKLRLLGRSTWPDRTIDGADSWIFDTPLTPARKLTTSGYGNPMNWGNRNFFVAQGKLYTGTNSAWNWADPAVSPKQHAGWQLLEISNLLPIFGSWPAASK